MRPQLGPNLTQFKSFQPISIGFFSNFLPPFQSSKKLDTMRLLPQNFVYLVQSCKMSYAVKQGAKLHHIKLKPTLAFYSHSYI